MGYDWYIPRVRTPLSAYARATRVHVWAYQVREAFADVNFPLGVRLRPVQSRLSQNDRTPLYVVGSTSRMFCRETNLQRIVDVLSGQEPRASRDSGLDVRDLRQRMWSGCAGGAGGALCRGGVEEGSALWEA
eukprot:3835011-Rhodomonas_salina.4